MSGIRIDFEFSGGWLAKREPGGFHGDTDQLESEEAREIESLVRRSGFLELRAGALRPKSPRARDAISYRLSVVDGERHNSLQFDDATAPPPLRSLAARLMGLARERGSAQGRTSRPGGAERSRR